MKDLSKKIQELNEENSKIFDEAIGFRNPIIKAKATMDDTGEEKTFYGFQSPIYKKDKKKDDEDKVGPFVKIGTNKYRVGKSIITDLRGASDAEVNHYNWEDSPLSWIIDCEFEGIMYLDLDNDELKYFTGIWRKGVFKGKLFSFSNSASFGLDQNSKVQFGDNSISPVYASDYRTWKASPMAFYNGTIKMETGGIFGMPDAVSGPVNGSFNILTLKPGNSLIINVSSKLPVRGAGGKMEKAPVSAVHELRMIKRIDSRSSDIILEVTNGETNNTVKKTYPWSDFRKSGIGSLTFVPGGDTMAVLKSAGIDLSNKSVTAEIRESGKSSLSDSPQGSAEAEKKLATTQQTFDLKKVPYLNIDKPAPGASGKMEPGMKETEVYFYSPNTDYLNKFNEVSKNIESGVMTSDMDIVASGIRNGVITGYYNYPFLKELFNNVQGGEAAPEGYAVPMKRLNDFYQYFVDRIYSQGDNGKINKPVQDLIKRKIKKALGVDAKIKAQQAAGAEEAQPETGGVTPTPKKGEAPVAEGVLISMRKIISENLKHF